MRFIAIKFVIVGAVCVASAVFGAHGQTTADMPTQTAPMLPSGSPVTLFPGLRALKGAPFSGSFSLESKQVLADGKMITHTRTGKVARDGEGPTYSEVTTPKPGGANGGSFTSININDPVSGTEFTLLPETRTARASSGCNGQRYCPRRQPRRGRS
jgi:hypothetical protein